MRESHALYHVGFNYNQLGKLKESLPAYHRSIVLAEPTGGPHLYRVLGLLGHIYALQGAYTVGLKYELRALQLAEAAGDTTEEIGGLHLFLGLAYEKLKDYTAARNHYEKGYRIDRHYLATSPGDFFALASNYAKMLAVTDPRKAISFLTGLQEEYKEIITPNRAMTVTMRLMQAYVKLNDFTTAQTYCHKLIAAVDAASGMSPLPAYMAISQFLVQSKQYTAAEKYLALAEQRSRAEKRIPNLQNIYMYRFRVDSAKGDYAGAIEKLKIHKAYSDSLLNEVKTKELALLEVEYETAKKEQSIVLLTKDTELSRQQLGQSRFQKNVFLVGLAVALLISALLFNQYRIKKKSNVELTRRQQEMENMNTLLQKTVLEKEWLLKEVHHRVKNNLQTVVSLLGSQLFSLRNSEAALAIQDSQNRVYAMSLIHQKLYQTEHRASINMAGYLGELAQSLRDSFPSGQGVQFQVDVQDIELDVSQAIPVGLMVNEAITNAMKYAFPAIQKEGRIVVAMRQDTTRHVLLTIADNGKGLPPDFDSAGTHFGMGLTLIHGLTEEIEGTCRIVSNDGAGVLVEIAFSASVLLE